MDLITVANYLCLVITYRFGQSLTWKVQHSMPKPYPLRLLFRVWMESQLDGYHAVNPWPQLFRPTALCRSKAKSG